MQKSTSQRTIVRICENLQVGKASRKKADWQTHLDAPAVIYGHHGMNQLQRQRFEAWKEWAHGLDVPEGNSVVFTKPATWREAIFNLWTYD